jgi:hypothetical protein
MLKATDKELSLVEAARVIYRTAAPSDEQIQRVYRRMKSGALAVRDFGRNPLEWTTTEGALADYLAARMVKVRENPTPASSRNKTARAPIAPRLSNRRAREASRLRSMYYGMWREYFLAVLLRRRMAHRSAAFRRAVLAGQIGLLVCLAALLVAAVRLTREPIAPERAAIERWIGQQSDRHQVVRWYPTQPAPDGNGLLVEVEYKYAKDSPRTVTTRRVFRVAGDEVDQIGDE